MLSSLVISWLFAKSITNAANLGLAFGLVGGVAYAAYYLSFAVAGWVIYRMRTLGGFRSIHHFLEERFGQRAMLLFTLLICFRLFNEVWSNTMVIGSYFGGVGEPAYYAAILVFTILTLAYSLKGGMSSSILTDVIQMVFFGILLAIILGAILPEMEYALAPVLSSGEWTMAAGGNLLLVALLQSFSYPFHDPVLTDRGFLSDPATTLKAFLWAAPIGFVCIVLFSVVGVYGGIVGVTGQAPVEVARLLGGPVLLVMNFIMITSAASTLDSTFTSFSKLTVMDLSGRFRRPDIIAKASHWTKVPAEQEGDGAQVQGEVDVLNAGNTEHTASSSPLPGTGVEGEGVISPLTAGRLAMIFIVILGTIPVFLNPEILSATTVSGAMVAGLAPVFCCWRVAAPPLSFWLSVGCGLFCGIVFATGNWPAAWVVTTGKYAELLAVTLVEVVACFGLYGLGILLNPVVSPLPGNRQGL